MSDFWQFLAVRTNQGIMAYNAQMSEPCRFADENGFCDHCDGLWEELPFVAYEPIRDVSPLLRALN